MIEYKKKFFFICAWFPHLAACQANVTESTPSLATSLTKQRVDSEPHLPFRQCRRQLHRVAETFSWPLSASRWHSYSQTCSQLVRSADSRHSHDMCPGRHRCSRSRSSPGHTLASSVATLAVVSLSRLRHSGRTLCLQTAKQHWLILYTITKRSTAIIPAITA